MRLADSTSIASRIEQAFQSASKSTGTSFEYLVKTAARESSFNPQAKAKTSSATGLFQFIESTWLETVKESGADHGLGKYADQIERTRSGKYIVRDPEMREKILNLRKDPDVASVMAGALTQKNADQLSRKLGRNPSQGELYMAHFLGAHGATRLINAATNDSEVRADKLFPAQARANKSIFYNRDGSARTSAEVYSVIASKHDAVQMIAGLSGGKGAGGLGDVAKVPSAKPGSEPFSVASNGGNGTAPVAAGFGENLDEATKRIMSAFRATETGNPFEALFRTDPGSETAGVSNSLLSAFSAQEESRYFSSASSQVAAQTLAPNNSHRPLDLTSFLRFDDKDQKDLLPPA